MNDFLAFTGGECQKFKYWNRDHARFYLLLIQDKRSQDDRSQAMESREYYCPHCYFWHLTSQTHVDHRAKRTGKQAKEGRAPHERLVRIQQAQNEGFMWHRLKPHLKNPAHDRYMVFEDWWVVIDKNGWIPLFHGMPMGDVDGQFAEEMRDNIDRCVSMINVPFLYAGTKRGKK